MSYLTPITRSTDGRAADDFQCGWSVLRMFAELSLQSGNIASESKPAKAPRRAVRAVQSDPEAA